MEWDLLKNYFQTHRMSEMQIESYNHLVSVTIPGLVKDHQFQVDMEDGKLFIIRFGNVYINTPTILNRNRERITLYPYMARERDISYETDVNADIYTMLVQQQTKDVIETKYYPHQTIFTLPVMIGSSLCNLKNKDPYEYNESPTDVGGYFIIRGKERVLISQERINYNHVYVYENKKAKTTYIAEVRSIKEDADYSVLIRMTLSKHTIMVSIPYIQKEIPLNILIRSLSADWTLEQKDVLDGLSQKVKTFLIHALAVQKSKPECIEWISRFTTNQIPEGKREQYTTQILENEVLPHLGIHAHPHIRIQFLIHMAIKLLQTHFGERLEDDREHCSNKRIETSGQLIGNLLKSLFKRYIKTSKQYMEKKKDTNILGTLYRFNISQRLLHCFTTGNWGVSKTNYIRQGVSQILSRLSYIGTISHLRRIIVPIGKESKIMSVRQIHPSSYGFIDPVETPEGQQAGLIKSFSLIVRVSDSVDTALLCDILHHLDIPWCDWSTVHSAVFVNGVLIGYVKRGDTGPLITRLWQARRKCVIPRDTSFVYDSHENTVQIHTDEGRLLRPLWNTYDFTMDEIQDMIKTHTWDELVERYAICWVDTYECNLAVIGKDLQDAYNRNTYYAEIHPSLTLGSCSSILPFPDHTQAPRNIYMSAMIKQSIGIYSLNFNHRYDTSAHVLHTPQKRLVETKYEEFLSMNENPCGTNVIVAIACYTGFNMEDSIILNKAAIDRGLFHSTVFKTISVSETKHGTHGSELFQLPPENIQNKGYDYSKLDPETGIIREGARVDVNTVLVGKVYSVHDEVVRDNSVACTKAETGIVDKVLVTTNSQEYPHVKIRIRSTRIPEVGDKFVCNAQKGTCGAIFPPEDMPFSPSSEMIPDLIINANCIPSRMTISILLEMLCGKANALSGETTDATAFCTDETLVDQVGNVLSTNGYEPFGNENFINGMTGEPLQMSVFMGVAYYSRLKHLVNDKNHVRARGNVQLLTRQPVAGRSKEGGLRIGEMERDALISHGTSIYLKERLFDMSDPYTLTICNQCGNPVNNLKLCANCNSDDTKIVNIPYASKLLFQQLNALGIKIKFS